MFFFLSFLLSSVLAGKKNCTSNAMRRKNKFGSMVEDILVEGVASQLH